MKASEAKTMADIFHQNDLMPQDTINSRLNLILSKIKTNAELGSYKIYENIDSQWSFSDYYNLKQKQHGRKELKKRLQNLGYKVISDGIFSIAKISWK